jgi:hypothetical protein
VTQCGTFPLKSQDGGALLFGFQREKADRRLEESLARLQVGRFKGSEEGFLAPLEMTGGEICSCLLNT